jgi:rhodanese-related sulfurtransferase
LLERGEAVVLDVRENVEWKPGRIPGALHVPLARVPARRHELPRDTTILTSAAAATGAASPSALLRQAGYQVENLAGGMKAWGRAGLPLDPPDGRVL